jgi:hypothetical protein
MPVTQVRSEAPDRQQADRRDKLDRFRCPITGYPCEGDLSYLCEDYGCARKGGLSPHSDENL